MKNIIDNELSNFKKILQKSSDLSNESPSMSFTPNVMRLIESVNIRIGWVGWTKRLISVGLAGFVLSIILILKYYGISYQLIDFSAFIPNNIITDFNSIKEIIKILSIPVSLFMGTILIDKLKIKNKKDEEII